MSPYSKFHLEVDMHDLYCEEHALAVHVNLHVASHLCYRL